MAESFSLTTMSWTENMSTLYNATASVTIRTKSSFLPVFILQICLGGIAVVVNLLVLCVFVIGKLRNSLSYMLSNLAVANTMLGIALSTRAAIEIMDEDVGYSIQFICHMTLMVAIMNMGTCITTIFCLCLNMYLSIGYAMHFRDGLSRQKTAIILAFWWLFWLGYSLAIFAAATNSANSKEAFSCNFASGRYNRNYVAAFVGLSLIISALTISFQYKTISAIRKQMMKVIPTKGAVTKNDDTGDFLDAKSTASSQVSAQRLHHMSITVALILGLYVLCWGPFMLAHFLANICPNQCSISQNTIMSVSTLPILHSLANIFIYSFRSKEFRAILFNRVFKRLGFGRAAMKAVPAGRKQSADLKVVPVAPYAPQGLYDEPYCGPDDDGMSKI